MKKAIDSQCQAFQQAIEVLGRPWTALILNVLQARPLRFSEISAAAQGPGDKVLSARLKDLEGNGLVIRQVHPGPPVRVTYDLTERGHGFHDVASAIERWGRCLTVPTPARTTKPRAAQVPEAGGSGRLARRSAVGRR